MVSYTCEECQTKWLGETDDESCCWNCGKAGVSLWGLTLAARLAFTPTEVSDDPGLGTL